MTRKVSYFNLISRFIHQFFDKLKYKKCNKHERLLLQERLMFYFRLHGRSSLVKRIIAIKRILQIELFCLIISIKNYRIITNGRFRSTRNIILSAV